MKYKIREVKPGIFAVLVKNRYDRAMLFCRVQEFYESPNTNFRDKSFSIWDYFRWYSKDSGSFTYPRDFSGFNMPLVVAKKCCDLSPVESPYDETMCEIVEKLFVNGQKQYLIGVEKTDDCLFRHEMAHALYYTRVGYKNEMDDITDSLPKRLFSGLKSKLKGMGYNPAVFKDEIQAYLSTEKTPVISEGLNSVKNYHPKYKFVFRTHTK